MSKRNFILLIIILIIAGAGIMWFFYYRQGINTAGGEVEGTNFISRFNPFATIKSTPEETPPADISGYQPNPPEKTNEKLKKVSSLPVAGFIVYNKERLKDIPVIVTPQESETTTTTPTDTTTPATPKKETKPTAPPTEFAPSVRYVDRINGNIYQTFADKIEERKFSSTVIPKVYEAYFGNKGEYVVMRYLKDNSKNIQTFVGNLPKEYLGADTVGESETTGTFLPENIKDISLSPDASGVFYMFGGGSSGEDGIFGTTFNFLTGKKAQVFESEFTEWLSLWPNGKTITLTTKPSSGVPGYMYTLDSVSGQNFKKILGGLNGLTTLMSPDSKLVLYGVNNLSLGIYHLDTKVSDSVIVKTMPEKCVWGKVSDVIYCAVPKSIPSGEYPDSWYRGEVSFSDEIWKMDVKTGTATILIDPVAIGGGEEVDGIKLALDENENYLFFVNKKDSFLWELNLK